jgi:molybdenum cofactor guanylyltransferase
VVLAGGLAARMNGADKPGLQVGGAAMLVAVARAAAQAGCRRLIVVGPERGGAVADGLAAAAADLPGGLITVREDPPGSGPVPALRRGLAEVAAPWLVLLAADLPFLTGAHLTRLLTAAGAAAGVATATGAVVVDAGGQPQWLVSCWRVAPLRAALDAYRDNSLRGLLGPLKPGLLGLQVAADEPAPWLDCDTPAELSAARAQAAAAEARQTAAGSWTESL